MDEFEKLVMLDREQFGGGCGDDTQRPTTNPDNDLAPCPDDDLAPCPEDGLAPCPEDGLAPCPEDITQSYPDDGSNTTEICEWPVEDEKEVDHTSTDDFNVEEYIKSLAEDGAISSKSKRVKKTKKVKERKLKCVCKVSCIDLFDKETVSTHILSMREMQKNEKEMYIMVSLQKVGNELTTRYGKRKRIRYIFKFDGKPVCRKTFCYLYDVGHKTLRGIQEHMNKNGIMPRVHGNTGRKPKNALKYAEVRNTVDFLTRYADEHGVSLPYTPLVEDEDPPIYLPSNLTKIKLQKEYKVTCEEAKVRALNITSFKEVWKHYAPHIKISNPKDDVHQRCEMARKAKTNVVSDSDKV